MLRYHLSHYSVMCFQVTFFQIIHVPPIINFDDSKRRISLDLNYLQLSRGKLKLDLWLFDLAGNIFSIESFYRVKYSIHYSCLRNSSMICQTENTRKLSKPKPVYGELRNFKFMPNLIFEFWIIKLPLLILMFCQRLAFLLIAECRPLIVGE